MNKYRRDGDDGDVKKNAATPPTFKAIKEGPSADDADGKTVDVVASRGANPAPGVGFQSDAAATSLQHPGNNPAQAEVNSVGGATEKSKRGRPKGSKNKADAKKASAQKLVGNVSPSVDRAETAQKLPATTQATQEVPNFQWIEADKLVRRPPFSTLLPINPTTYEAIKASMQAKGFDPTYPVHVWEHDGLLMLGDGFTRDKVAGELGITRLPAFVHHFKEENEALTFAIQGQLDRRNLTSGETFLLIGALDKVAKAGSSQQLQEDGTFGPKAADDAIGKTSKQMAEKLKTTATNIERCRYLHKYADAAIKAAVTNNKVTLSRACKVTSKRLVEQAKAGKNAPGPQKGAKSKAPLPFELTPESDVAFGVWQPVIRNPAKLSHDVEAELAVEGADEYALAEEVLELPEPAKKLLASEMRRVLVLPELDLFAAEMPAKLIRPVMKAAAEAKQFHFLFTTQNPERLQEFSWEPNTFAGVSIFGQKDVGLAEDALQHLDGLGKWLLVEQLTMELTFQHLDQVDWLVVRQGAGVPGVELAPHALKSLLQQAWAANCPVLFERGISYRSADAPKVVAQTSKGEVANHG